MDFAMVPNDGPWWHSIKSEANGAYDDNTPGSTEGRTSLHVKILTPPGKPPMSGTEVRQRAEDPYYAALDLMADGKLAEAVAAYRESITIDPSFTEAMHGLARALQDLQRYDEAISVAQRITELDADDVLAHTSLSVLYQKKGMIPEAEAEGAKARVLGWKQQLKKS
jgi:tetratricopeptide (TPR) repeat protein